MWRDAAARLLGSGTGNMRLFRKEMPLGARLLFLPTVCSIYATVGVISDIISAGLMPLGRVAFQVSFSGSIAMLDGFVALRPSVIGPPTVVALQLLVRVLPAAGDTRKGGLLS